jgi:tRNA (guanine37-N1)-methyltransferase
MSVPEVLLQGNHGEIEKWRHAQQLERTQQFRPDLLKKQP